VPIIPNFLFKLEHPDEYDVASTTTPATTSPPSYPRTRDGGVPLHCRLLPEDFQMRRPGGGRGDGSAGGQRWD